MKKTILFSLLGVSLLGMGACGNKENTTKSTTTMSSTTQLESGKKESIVKYAQGLELSLGKIQTSELVKALLCLFLEISGAKPGLMYIML